MAVTDPKCKLVSFRLSATEYAAALGVCRTRGYRCLSSFARSAVLAFTPAPKFAPDYDSVEQDLRLRVERLAAELKSLSERLDSNGDASATLAPPSTRSLPETNTAALTPAASLPFIINPPQIETI